VIVFKVLFICSTRTREKVVYSSEELEAQILLMKDWTRYRMKFHNMEMKACFKMKAAEQKALDKLREESEELYQQAIQVMIKTYTKYKVYW
jgi:large subunit ribosomal protein L40